MDDARSALLDFVARLNPDGNVPVQLRGILRRAGIELVKHILPKARVPGALRRISPDVYRIDLYRHTELSMPLSVRERFTIAHEIGHWVLDSQLKWSPQSEREFHLTEDACNRFAAALLVPDRVTAEFRSASPQESLLELTRVARVCRVSPEVAARRIVEAGYTIAFFCGEFVKNARGSDVFRILWGAAPTNQIRVTRNRHLGDDDPLGRELLRAYKAFALKAAPVEPLRTIEFVLPANGLGIAHRLNPHQSAFLGSVVWSQDGEQDGSN